MRPTPPPRRNTRYAFGSSQSGRFLRNFLYDGFNTDERNRQVFDAVMAHIAGAARIDLNRRWATPTGLGQFTRDVVSLCRLETARRVTGVEEGALDNPRARDHQPKIFYTNTGVEYWGGGRSAALIHTTPDGARDLALPDNELIQKILDLGCGGRRDCHPEPPKVRSRAAAKLLYIAQVRLSLVSNLRLAITRIGNATLRAACSGNFSRSRFSSPSHADDSRNRPIPSAAPASRSIRPRPSPASRTRSSRRPARSSAVTIRSGRQESMILSPGRAYAMTVGVASIETPQLARVTPGDPANSYLYRKITGAGITGDRMPQNLTPLD